MTLLELLTAGKVDEFNNTRTERGRLDFFAADLANAKLAGVDLSGANVEKADLSDADLTGASLFRTRLTGIDGSNLKLNEVLGARCKLAEAWLEAACLDDAELSQSDLREAYLVKSHARGLRLTGAKLAEADAHDAVWPGVDLSEASLHKANFAGANLGRADMTDANGNTVDFTGANLDGLTASRARLQGSVFKDAHLVAARLDDANLSEADFSGADLSGADLTGANLSSAIIAGAKLLGAVLSGAVLDGVDFTDVDLTDVELTGVDPGPLGLSEAQLEQVASIGSIADLSAPLVASDVRAASNGDTVMAFWENADSEVERSLRWVLFTPKGEHRGVLPIGTEGVLARAVAAVTDGYEIIVLQERPGGVALLAYRVNLAGESVSSRHEALGFTPAILPIVRGEGDSVLLWSMARRGPTLVVQRLDGEGLSPVHSERIATGRGFLGRHLPVVACKGDVWMAVGRDGAATPMGAPEAFPGVRGVATPVGDGVMAVWGTAGKRDRPGVLSASRLVRRGAPDVETIATTAALSCLDTVPVGGDVWVTWSDVSGVGTRVFRARVGGEPLALPAGLDDVSDVRFAPGPLDATTPPPVVVVGGAGELVVLASDGRVLGRVAE